VAEVGEERLQFLPDGAASRRARVAGANRRGLTRDWGAPPWWRAARVLQH
jgi:hypothetical protein